MTRFSCSSAQLRGFGSMAVIRFNSTPTKDWKCADWVTWHKLLRTAFEAGSFASGIKYTKEKAIELSNQVFRQWWEKLAGFFSYNKSWCGYEGLFYAYMKEVGLNDILTILQKLANPVLNTTVSTVETAASTVDKVVDSSGKVIENVAETVEKSTDVIKWVVPVVITVGVVGVSVWAYKTYL